MKKINFKMLIITCIMCLVPIIFGLIFYDSLPESVAIHFDINNNPDNFASREFFVFGMPVILMLIQIFCCVTTDLADENPEANKKSITVMKFIIPVITVVLYVVTLLYAMKIQLDIRIVVMILLGVILIVMGNYTPKLVETKNRYFHLGACTIKNRKLNNKIKRITAYMLIIDGFLFILSTLFKPVVSVLVLVLLILQSLVLYMYALIKDKLGDEKIKE